MDNCIKITENPSSFVNITKYFMDKNMLLKIKHSARHSQGDQEAGE